MPITPLVTALLVTLLAQTDAAPIQRMVSTERAFAAATAELGIRDGFLTFFADDAVSIAGGADGSKTTVVPARAALRDRPEPPLPLAATLTWAPFTGQISSDGSMGWLTGGFASLVGTTREVAGQGAYFSVWKRQPDGTWRVWLDEGITIPKLWRSENSSFVAAPDPDAAASGGSAGDIQSAEQLVASGGEGWRSNLGQAVRLHRDGEMPLGGRDAAIAWADGAWKTVRYSLVKTDVAVSGDLGVAIGGYDATTADGGAPEHGTFVRMWKRDVTGHWRIVFETNRKTN